ncbi:MAG: UDP-N-acetylmuramyl-tripeptide synthetase, partial [Candidatus Omnitrophota bacterium]|nr:UDP-N-acetylmuramyl-tripeptide synthetase [Candidatus Omnitrophota bacterium]
KRLLFESLKRNSAAVLNSDDRHYRRFKKLAKSRVISYGIEKKADFRAVDMKLDINGSRFFMDTPNGLVNLRTPLIGRYNVYNILAAAAFAFAEGISPSIVNEAISRTGFIKGRMESIEAGQRFRVFVDYAHTYDALKNVLRELRAMCNGNLIVVFGCGGDRDRSKRPGMGMIASRLADYVFLTNDNPRTENPEAIIDEIESGIRKGFRAYEKVPDRSKAIEKSLLNRGGSDIVVISGKGHENYQIIGKKKFPFNDKAAAGKILRRYCV